MKTEMKTGRYQMVLLERADNHGEVYFFNGAEINLAQVAAQAVVQVQTPDRENTNSRVARTADVLIIKAKTVTGFLPIARLLRGTPELRDMELSMDRFFRRQSSRPGRGRYTPRRIDDRQSVP